HLIFAELAFLFAKVAAEGRMHALYVEIVRRNAAAAQQRRLIGSAERRRPSLASGEVLEDGVLLFPIQVIERGDSIGSPVRTLLHDAHDAIRVGVGQRVQQDSVDEAEDGGVGADAQRQGQQRDGS